jgi:hypothetical protein
MSKMALAEAAARVRRARRLAPLTLLAGLAVTGLLASGCGRILIGTVPGTDSGGLGGYAANDANAGNDGGGGGDPDARADQRATPIDSAGDAPGAADARASTDVATDGPHDATAGDSDTGDTSDANDAGNTPPIGIIAGRITMSDTLGVRGAGVAGVRVALSGLSVRDAISDANGAYQFPNLAPGTYAVAVSKDGAAFTPATTGGVVVGGDGDGVVTSFACTAPCGTGPAIDPTRELFMQDATVLADDRAQNGLDGVWSFRFLMEQASTTTSANVYANAWIDNLANSGRDVSALRAQWPTITESGQILPDLSQAPFQLLAIVNGIDVHVGGQGELRFVYGIRDVPGAPGFSGQGRVFTVMFTYALPATVAYPTRPAWARAFHALGALPFGPSYNAALEALTTVVTRVGAQPSSADNPRGSALTTVSINEAFRTQPYQFRQFRPLPDPVRGYPLLVVSPLLQTPDSTLSTQAGDLPDFLNANAALVQAGLAPLPARLLATQSSSFSLGVTWSFPSVGNEALRHAFAGQTCVGCHSSEAPSATIFTIFHVIPFNDASEGGTRSGWVTGTELPRRTSFLQNQLTCSGATCALGAEPMMGPTR